MDVSNPVIDDIKNVWKQLTYFFATQNGVLLRTVLDMVTGDLSDTRTRYRNLMTLQMENRISKIASCLFFFCVVLVYNLVKVSSVFWLFLAFIMFLYIYNIFVVVELLRVSQTELKYLSVCGNWSTLAQGICLLSPWWNGYIFPLWDGSASIVLYWKRTLGHTV